MKKRIILLIFILSLSPLWANETGHIKIYPDIRFWGSDLKIAYGDFILMNHTRTWLEIAFGGGNEEFGYFRHSDDSYYTPPIDTTNNLANYKKMNFDWGLAIRQGFLFDKRKDDNLLEAHVIYRGGLDFNDTLETPQALIFQTSFTDKERIFSNSMAFGLFYNSIVKNNHNNLNGFSLDITTEWAPRFFMNNLISETNYQRLTLDARGFFTVLDLENKTHPEKNLFSIYIGDRITFDALFGNQIPILARQSTGGNDLAYRKAIGGIVRGIESCRFDGYLKLVNNFDIRFLLPTLDLPKTKLPLSTVQPGFVFYFDTAVKSNFDYRINFDEIFNSTGIGTFLSAHWVDLILSLDYFIHYNNFNYNKFSFSFGFSFHFD